VRVGAVAHPVAVLVLDCRGAQRIALAPFLLLRRPVRLAVAQVALDRLAAVDLGAVTMLPLAPAALEQEAADQQPQHEHQSDDDPLVGGETHHDSYPLTFLRWE
jgi:hypothetical protein